MEAFRQLWRGSWRTGPLLSRMTSAEIVALFITAMDKLKLDIRSMDYLHADLKDVEDNLSRLSFLLAGISKIVGWLEALCW